MTWFHIDTSILLEVNQDKDVFILLLEGSGLVSWRVQYDHFCLCDNSIMILNYFSSDSCDPLECTRLPSCSLSAGVCSNSCPLNQWCHLTISSSATLFSFCLQSYPASGSFPMSWLFSSGDQSIRISALASILPVNVRDWFPLGLTDFISLHSKDLSIFSSTAIQKHQVLGTQPSLWSNSHIHTWPLKKP